MSLRLKYHYLDWFVCDDRLHKSETCSSCGKVFVLFTCIQSLFSSVSWFLLFYISGDIISIQPETDVNLFYGAFHIPAGAKSAEADKEEDRMTLECIMRSFFFCSPIPDTFGNLVLSFWRTLEFMSFSLFD
jgi:hypothetical protein